MKKVGRVKKCKLSHKLTDSFIQLNDLSFNIDFLVLSLVEPQSAPEALKISLFPSDFFPPSIIELNFVSSNEISAVFSFHFVDDLIDSIEALRIGVDDAKDDDVKEFM